MTSQSETFRQSLVKLGFDKNCISEKTSIREQGKRFSIRPYRNLGEVVLQIKLDGCQFRDEKKRCDALFLCKPLSGPFLVILVELKGKNLPKAFQQIEATLERLCAHSVHNFPHKSKSLEQVTSVWGTRHKSYAYIVSRSGRKLPQLLSKRDKMQKQYGIRLYHKEQQVELDGLSALTNES